MRQPDRAFPVGSPAHWMELARNDLRVARLALVQMEISPGIACFHAQQAAEKALKSVLVYRELQFPLVHDIGELFRFAELQGIPIPENVTLAQNLSIYAVESRYPHGTELTRAEVEEAAVLADAVVTWAEQEL